MNNRAKALAEFWRMVGWIIVIAALMAGGAILYLSLTVGLDLHLVIATLGGVFISVVLGCGLMAASFFSNKSGHDQVVSDATRQQDEESN
jgi:hypothetical protein